MSAPNQEQKTLKFQSLKPLTKEQIEHCAPQVYTDHPYSKTSKKYTFLPTYQIIEDMDKLGWKVCQAVAMKSDDQIQAKYGKHMIKFFNPDIFISDGKGGVEAYPQILIMNNHRGWGKFKFEIGVFRLVCSNGLVVKDRDMGSFVMRHLGYSFEELKKLVGDAVNALPGIVKKINMLSERVMTAKEQADFAKKALEVRLGEERECTDLEIRQVLQSTRKEDDGNTLWKVFNRVQEHLIKGGFETQTANGSARKVRKITNMMKDLELNQKLWALTEEYAYAA